MLNILFEDIGVFVVLFFNSKFEFQWVMTMFLFLWTYSYFLMRSISDGEYSMNPCRNLIIKRTKQVNKVVIYR